MGVGNTEQVQQWLPPAMGQLKVNIDAAFQLDEDGAGHRGAGLVIGKSSGRVVIVAAITPTCAECRASRIVSGTALDQATEKEESGGFRNGV